jgi:predicted metal-dependent phosphoesterase TrpH
MTYAKIAGALVAGAMVLGALSDRAPALDPITLGGYRVLAADFHVHDSLWSDATLTPFGLVAEARHQGLDAIAITGHRQTHDAKWGRWFSERIGGPTVLVGEELPEIAHHVIAVGIQSTIDGALPVAAQIAEIHRQGGIAIAAHPMPEFWPGFRGVEDTLDGSEICHPLLVGHPGAETALAEFNRRVDAAAIGSSDFHGSGRLGQCRTFVFATDATRASILDAIRARRTVVYTPSGGVYGDPQLVALSEADGRLRTRALAQPPVSLLDWAGRLLGLAGLAALVIAIR